MNKSVIYLLYAGVQVHDDTMNGQNGEGMEAQVNHSGEIYDMVSPGRVNASFVEATVSHGDAVQSGSMSTRCFTPPPELLYPFESLALDTSVAPGKHIQDLLLPFGVRGCQENEFTLTRSDELVDALLDEGLVHRNPFKAAMSLVYASHLGLQWDYAM